MQSFLAEVAQEDHLKHGFETTEQRNQMTKRKYERPEVTAFWDLFYFNPDSQA